jgi:transposase
LRDAPSGRRTGDGRLLSAQQEALVRRLIIDKTPDQLQMPCAVWTRAAVAQIIERPFGIRMAVRTMGLYLARWGFTPQKPMKKACEQSPASVRKWLDEDCRAIADDIKQAVTTQAPARTKLQGVKAAAGHLRSAQRQPERIRKYFEHGPVRCAV